MPTSRSPNPQQRRAPLRAPILVTIIAVVAALVLIGGIANATPAQADGRLLIGMGDSYSTAAGIPPVDQSSGQCQRSAAAYPLVAAAELGFDGQNVACGGAVVADFTTPSRRGEPPQISGIADADVIAFTMGGNDVGGPNGVLDSSRSSASMAGFAAAVAVLAPRLVAAYADVQRAAPAAEVFVLGYPDIVPHTQEALEACLGAGAQGLDADLIHRSVGLLNAAIADAAASAAAVFVDTTPSFAGHEMCTAEPYANAPGDRASAWPGGALHPNELGHLALAADLVAAIGGFELRTSPVTPTPPRIDPPIAAPPVGGPLDIPIPVLTPQERATALAILAALLNRIREAVRERYP